MSSEVRYSAMLPNRDVLSHHFTPLIVSVTLFLQRVKLRFRTAAGSLLEAFVDNCEFLSLLQSLKDLCHEKLFQITIHRYRA